MKRFPFAAFAAILAAALLVSGAAPALAHDALKSSSPAKGAEVEALDEVELEFTAKVRMPFVIVRGPGDDQHQQGKPELDGAVVRQAVKGPLPDGKYTIAYRVVSSDGHPIEGEIPFRVEGARTPSPGPEEETATSEAPASVPASPGPSEPAASAPPSEGTSADADQASAQQQVTFPVWLIIVIGALVGIGIGFLLSARKKKP
ncbi:copper resistance protein CopC [Nonomuraea longispora]|uniref:Copper resistance protein CopC n=1 Tax=Nonomuraea longispora TaxID=1848320 RepID=A0A4R4NM09_9ACTN|nr:copper resistance CopC family protein [Nonomuraea longispora]TDC10245.1 copper resistance protein CopC [Nonomuraea longispora]